jgi:hypothetical protein
MLLDGEMSRFFELLRESERGTDGNALVCDGEGDLERRLGVARLGLFAREGADGDVNPRRIDL